MFSEWKSNKSLPEPAKTKFTDAHFRHDALAIYHSTLSIYLEAQGIPISLFHIS